MNMTGRKISVLGTDYTIRFVEHGQDEYMDKMNFGGYCDGNKHEIVVLLLKTCENWKNEPKETIDFEQRKTLRHELVHAFLNESGLQWNANSTEGAWARNAEMVDWFAIQSPKIYKVFQGLGVL